MLLFAENLTLMTVHFDGIIIQVFIENLKIRNTHITHKHPTYFQANCMSVDY